MNNKVAITAIAGALVGGFAAGVKGAQLVFQDRMEHNVPLKVLEDIVRRACEDDSTPEEIRRMVVEGSEFIKMTKKV